MRQEFVNPFLSPAQNIWKKEFNLDLAVTSAQAVAYQYTTEDVTAIIGVSGKLEGNVLYGFSDVTSRNIVERMVGPGASPKDPIGLSALGEIANIVSGNAATSLASAGYPCDISPPIIIEPRGSTITSTVQRQILVTFMSEIGELKVRIGLTENTGQQRRAA
jgi:chemotaxis protein CheX